MYEIIIRDYVNKLTEDDIIQYSKRKNISLNDDEVKVLYLYAKNYWREFYRGQPWWTRPSAQCSCHRAKSHDAQCSRPVGTARCRKTSYRRSEDHCGR